MKTLPKRRSRIAATIASLAIAGGAIMTTPAHAQGLSITQGDRFITDLHEGEQVGCTTGYLDKNHRTLRVTGHCSHGQIGNIVRDKYGRSIGRVIHNEYRGNPKSDISVISINPGVQIGGNIHSGDRWAPPREVLPGDRLCSRSSKKNATLCGNVLYVDGNVIVGTRNAGGIPGDSGGPAWVPGKGFVGTFSGIRDNSVLFTYPDQHPLSYADLWMIDRRKDIENIQRTVETNTRNAIVAFLNDLEYKLPQFKPQIQQLRKEFGV